jgi:uncharacterized SAM-binding protein YcdF (DUF218 family)
LIYLHKILPFFVSPLGIIFIFLFTSFFFKKKFFVFLAFLVLIVSTNPLVGNYLMQRLEYPYKPISIYSISKADAIVVLGGVLKKIEIEKNISYEFSEGDRFFSSIELINKNKANKLIYMGSQLPWTDNWKPEGHILKDKAISLGVLENKILVTEKVKNTFEESLAVKKLIPNNSSIILVTSAYHMHRSKHLFDKQGFKVTPFPVDFRSSNLNITILSFLPNLNAMGMTSKFIKENIGRLYYEFFI